MPRRLLPIANVRQQRASDCLVACAAMQLAALGLVIPYPRLLSILDVSPWGTPHSNLRKLSGLVSGIQVTHRQGELPDLTQAIERNCPPAAFVWTGELTSYWSTPVYHAVVVIGYDDENFYINDPASEQAPQQVSQSEFDLAWLAHDTYFATVERM